MVAATPEVRQLHARTSAAVLVIGAIVGLLIRRSTFFYMGTFDMDAYYEWGKRALESGLPRSYHGIYFPLQYQLFEVCAWLVHKLGAEFFTVFKLSNLLFDIGSFCLLVFLLKRQRSNPAYALLYWLHPWFLAVFSLGYIDFQFTFFVLLGVWLLRLDTALDYLLAGIPLGLAFLMKPQAQILVVATFFYGVCSYIRTKNTRPLAMLVGPMLIFFAYEIYFVRTLPRPRYLAALVLPSSYLNVTNVMPALTAQMTNVWYPIAYLIKHPGQPLHTISDQIHVLPYISAKYSAAIVVLGLIGFHIFRVERQADLSVSDRFVRIFGFATLVVPFLMTSAHENHLFLGSVFLVLIAAGRPSRVPAKIAIQVMLLVQFLNIYELYGTHPHGFANLLRRIQSDEVAVVYSVISVICFCFMIKPLWSGASHGARPTVASARG